MGYHRYRHRPERGSRTNGRLRYEPSEGEFDWYTIYDPEEDELYLFDANGVGKSVELRLEEPRKWDAKIKMAADHRFADNWPP